MVAAVQLHELTPSQADSVVRIAVVDDDAFVRGFLQRGLAHFGWEVEAFSDAESAVSRISEGGFAAALVDLRMPGRDGLWALEQILARDSDVAVLVVSAMDEVDTAVHCLTHGAEDYVQKPVRLDRLGSVVERALENRHLRMENRAYGEHLEVLVAERTRELEKAVVGLKQAGKAVERAYEQSLSRLAEAAEFRDGETGLHIRRVGLYVRVLAKACGCSREEVRFLMRASPMHDVGKVAVRDAVLLKPGRLTKDEFEEMKRHTIDGAKILAGRGSPLMQLAQEIALTHHEKWDGSGYPRGLRGEDIPFSGRVTALADVFDALTTNRIYRPAFPYSLALNLLREESGRHFDPRIVNAFFGILDEVEQILLRHADPGCRLQV